MHLLYPNYKIMAIPVFEEFLYPFMNHLMEVNSNKSDMVDYLVDYFNLTEDDRNLKTKGGQTTQLYDRVGWCLQWLRRAMFVEIPSHGVWRITNRGRDYMNNHKQLREKDLLQYPEFAEYSRGKKSKISSTVPNIHKTILEISQNTNFIKSILRSHLILLGYEVKEIDDELGRYSYNWALSDGNQVKDNIPENESINTLDTTRFSFDGGRTFYNKRLFVLNVIRKYVNEHPNITIDELEDVFPSSISSKKRGVIRPLSVVKEWIKGSPDVAKRYFMKEDEIITLRDGTKIVVHNQWGTRFPAFLDIAIKLYDVRSDQLYHGRKNLYSSSDNADDQPHSERPFGINIPVDSLNRFKSKK